MLGRTSGNFSANKSTGSNYVQFSHMATDQLHMRPQKAGQYIEGYGRDIPNLGSDLRWLGNSDDVDSLELHHEDVETFIKRVKKHLEETEPKDDNDPLNFKRF